MNHLVQTHANAPQAGIRVRLAPESSDGVATTMGTKRMLGFDATHRESGTTVTVAELSSIVAQILERALQPTQEQLGLFVRYLRRKPGRGLAVVYSADARNVQQGVRRHSRPRLLTVTLDEAALVGTRILFHARQVQQSGLEFRTPGILRVGELGLIVHVFPADNGLPTLAASCTTARDTLLFTTLEAAAQMQLSDQDWHLLSAEVEPVRYKPSSRCVLRYTLELQRKLGKEIFHRELSLYGKVYSDSERARTLHAIVQQLYAEQAGARTPIMPRPLTMVDALGLTLNEEVQSAKGAKPESLRTGLEALRPRFRRGRDGQILDPVIPDRDLCITANALAVLHTSAVRITGPLRTGAKEGKRATERATLIASHCPGQAEAVQRLAKQVATRLKTLEPDEHGPAHGGFKPSQLLFCGERVFVLDMDGLCLADAALDVGYFLAYLRPSCLWYHRPGARRWFEGASASFVNAYRQALSKCGISETTICDILKRASLYEAAILFKIATRRANRLNSPRPGELSAMLSEITVCLSDGS
jgi:phosphotransferase family enzyme